MYEYPDEKYRPIKCEKAIQIFSTSFDTTLLIGWFKTITTSALGPVKNQSILEREVIKFVDKLSKIFDKLSV